MTLFVDKCSDLGPAPLESAASVLLSWVLLHPASWLLSPTATD